MNINPINVNQEGAAAELAPNVPEANNDLQATPIQYAATNIKRIAWGVGMFVSSKAGAGIAVRIGSNIVYQQAYAAASLSMLKWVPGACALVANSAVGTAAPYLLGAGYVAGGGAFITSAAVANYAVPKILSSAHKGAVKLGEWALSSTPNENNRDVEHEIEEEPEIIEAEPEIEEEFEIIERDEINLQ
jgi:hypothetical protein